MPDPSRRLKLFKDETAGHITKIKEGLNLYLNQNESAGTIKEMHRSAHTIKGVSGLLDLRELSELGLRLEMIFEKVQEGHSVLVGDLSVVVEGLVKDVKEELDKVQELIIKIEAEKSEADLGQGKKNILIVEDEQIIADILKELLLANMENKLNIFIASTLADANQLLLAKHFDLILLDLTLPDSAGLATLKTVQLHCRDAMIVIMTGYGEDIVAQFKREDVSEVLIKGQFDIEQIQDLVTKYLKSGKPKSSKPS